MDQKLKETIEEYQCSGCVVGSDIECFKPHGGGKGCGAHLAGTLLSGIGKIFLGLPKGFCRLGFYNNMIPRIYTEWEEDQYNMWNMPVWKHLDTNGNTLVRGMCPRTNWPFIDIFIGDVRDKIECLEITQEQVNAMD